MNGVGLALIAGLLMALGVVLLRRRRYGEEVRAIQFDRRRRPSDPEGEVLPSGSRRAKVSLHAGSYACGCGQSQCSVLGGFRRSLACACGRTTWSRTRAVSKANAISPGAPRPTTVAAGKTNVAMSLVVSRSRVRTRLARDSVDVHDIGGMECAYVRFEGKHFGAVPQRRFVVFHHRATAEQTAVATSGEPGQRPKQLSSAAPDRGRSPSRCR